jgi:hypothetical protein
MTVRSRPHHQTPTCPIFERFYRATSARDMGLEPRRRQVAEAHGDGHHRAGAEAAR